ncbi:hypothetical protein BDW62DRAFT_105635 [Aspergillus aurantiobrunneus]
MRSLGNKYMHKVQLQVMWFDIRTARCGSWVSGPLSPCIYGQMQTATGRCNSVNACSTYVSSVLPLKNTPYFVDDNIIIFYTFVLLWKECGFAMQVVNRQRGRLGFILHSIDEESTAAIRPRAHILLCFRKRLTQESRAELQGIKPTPLSCWKMKKHPKVPTCGVGCFRGQREAHPHTGLYQFHGSNRRSM